MNEQENIQLIKDAYGAFARGDVQSILATLSNDVDWYQPGPKEIPMAGRFKGPEAVATWFQKLGESDDVLAFEPKQFFAAGDTVVARGYYSAKVKSTGKTSHIDWVQVFTIRDGKVTSWTEYYDTALVAECYRVAAAV